MSTDGYQKSIVSLFIKFCIITMLILTSALLLAVVPAMKKMYEENRVDDVADIAQSYKLIAENYFRDRIFSLYQFSRRSIIINSLMQDHKHNLQLKDLLQNSGIFESEAKISIYNINNELFSGTQLLSSLGHLQAVTQKIISGKYPQYILVDSVKRKLAFIVPIKFKNSIEGAIVASIPFDFSRIVNLKDVNSQIALRLQEGHNYVDAGAKTNKFLYPFAFTEQLNFPNLYLHVTVDMKDQYEKSRELLNYFVIKLIIIIFICIMLASGYGYKQLIKPYIALEEKDKALSKTVEGICKLNSENKIIFFNDAMKNIFRQRESLMGIKFSSLFKGDSQDEVDSVLINYTDEVKTLSLPYEDNGELRVANIHISYVDYDKCLKYCFIQDITEKAKMESMKQSFVSIINHELRTPLTAIQGSLGLIQKLVDDTLNPKVKSLLSICYKNSMRLGLLINDILDVEKISAGRMAYDIQQEELNALLEEIVQDCTGYAINHEVSIRLEKAKNEVFCDIDRNRFTQAVLNIISNSAKFSPPESVITVMIVPVSKSKVKIAIRDKGVGIPKHLQSKLFTKFTQGDVSEHNKTKGTGLGLYITKTFIEAMGGEISFESEEGKGTTFYIMLSMHIESSNHQ